MKNFQYLQTVLLLLPLHSLVAATLQSVEPLTDRILVVHFDDGYVRHHQLGEERTNEWVVGSALDVQAASVASAYALVSTSDPQYAVPRPPLGIFRKTKPTDFTWLCQGWNGNCVNNDPDHAAEHWLYLRLPTPLQNGMAYTLQLPSGLADAPVTFTFNDRTQHSEAVHTNLLGYVPGAPEKFGYVYHWLGDGGGMDFSHHAQAAFHLVRTTDGGTAYTGQLQFRKGTDNTETAWTNQAPPTGNLVGVEVYECDFSAFDTPGEYRLCVEGIGCSFTFDIGAEVYALPCAAVLNGLYQQRSGIATVAPYTDQPRPAPHHPVLTPGFDGQLVYSAFRYPDFAENDAPAGDRAAIEAAIRGPLSAWGWYQDAGDWDSYYAHTDVPMQLLWLYEMGQSKFGDNQFLLPEAGNGLPDLLDEATWLPRFHHRLRQELVARGYGTGGVGGGRVFGDLWGGDVRPDNITQGSWQDIDRRWVCTGEDPFITYKYAGLAAHTAYLLAGNGWTDPQDVDWRQEAVEAYQWARANTLPQDDALFGMPLLHIRIHAAAQLYRLTGDAAYHQDFLAAHLLLPNDVSFTPDLIFGLLAYTQTSGIRPVDQVALDAARGRLLAEADFILLGFRDNRACRWGGNFWQPLLIGQATTPLVQAGIVGHYLASGTDPVRAAQYRAALYSTADYFLGNNPLNMTWITGVGERSPEEVFNMDSWYIGGDVPRRGIVPYGPWEVANYYGPLGPWNHEWPFEYTYPANPDAWPAHERWFNQRTAPLASEYTIYQTLAPSIFTYGYLYSLTAPDLVSGTVQPAQVLPAGKVYPNPVVDVLHVDAPLHDGAVFTIVDAAGKVCRSGAWERPSIQVADLAAGWYRIAVVAQGQTVFHAPFVVVPRD